MQTRKFALAALAASVALSIAGCAGGSPEPAVSSPAAAPAATVAPSSSEAPVATDAGPNDVMPEFFEQGDFYFVSAENVVGKFTIPGDPVPRLESLRKAAGAAPVSYLTVKLDGRQATDGANMYALDIFDPDGKKYSFTDAYSVIGEWHESVDIEDTDLYNRFVDAINAEPYHVDKSEVGTIVMVSDSPKLPTEITRISVMPLGAFGETDAYPVEMGQGLDLGF